MGASHDTPNTTARAAVRGFVCSAALIGLACLVFASLPVKIAGAVFALAVLHGVWRGGARLAGTVAGLVLAALLAAPLGRGCEGVVGSIAGTTGLTNRLLSMSLAAAAVLCVVGGLAGLAARKLSQRKPEWQSWDRVAGGVLGGIEGVLLALLALWIPLALAPVAQNRLEADAREDRPESALAASLMRLNREVGDSALGALARATNPFSESELLGLAEDFAAVSRHPPAMEYFLSTPVMVAVAELPSVTRGIEAVKNDRSLAPYFERGEASVGAIRAVMDSPTLLRVLDETSILSDLSPRMKDLVAAVREAKALIPPEQPD